MKTYFTRLFSYFLPLLILTVSCFKPEPSIPLELIGPEVVSSNLPEFATSISKNNDELFFNRTTADRNSMQIMVAEMVDNKWITPKALEFSTGDYRDVDPYLSRNGERLYFSSTRPTSSGDTIPDFNTWYVDRTDEGWSEPVNPGSPLNSDETEIFICMAKNGNAYFVSERYDRRGIVVSKFDNNTYQEPEPLYLKMKGKDVYASNPCISADESFLIVAYRPEGQKDADLYVSFNVEGTWSELISLGSEVNSPYADFAPGLSWDNNILYFTSERPGIVAEQEKGVRPPGDIYRIGLKNILNKLREESTVALQYALNSLNSNNESERMSALKTLSEWKTNDALIHLYNVASKSEDNGMRSQAFEYYLDKISQSDLKDDQKLLLIRKIMPLASSVQQKENVLRSAGSAKTFLSFVFVSEYLGQSDLALQAAQTASSIALPTAGKENGLSGDYVREILGRCTDVLQESENQEAYIKVQEYLDKMSSEKGFESIFNGVDFTGWEGLVANPIARGKMSKQELQKAQIIANDQMVKDWFVKDGVIGFQGEGYNNICTIKDYGDFEMLVDWKITNGGDSGIYLRGTPQVQIWDIARINAGAQVGSGGLYNNQKNERIPIVLADNPINEWNTFRIKMVGERVTVHLNGVLVTDNVILENYWDRSLPIFAKEAIELQAHGEDLGFRNIFVREIHRGDEILRKEEREAGYVSLFNGKDLDHWIGNKKDYIVENDELVIRPEQGGHGNLYTAAEYSDFSFRFEFKLTPGANNGLGIHTPTEGDAAYVGKELQILDNSAAKYAKLNDYQFHGSVYGVIPAKRGFLKPVGEWNSQEVIVQGDDIKIILNGTVIVDGNLKEASKNGTIDGLEHPGLERNSGHIGFLGHGSELYFRSIRIKDLSK